MARRRGKALWSQALRRGLAALQRQVIAAAAKPRIAPNRTSPRPRRVRREAGQWLPGVAVCPQGLRRFYLYRPQGVQRAERLPLLVMLHGCGQDALGFAALTRMNQLAERHRFLVLYPEQDRLSNPQGCWNWYATQGGRAEREADTLLAALDQVCLLHPVDRQRVALVGLSAGASMAALLALQAPERFKAVVMHSGVPPGSAHSALSALQAMRGRRSAVTPDATQRPAGVALPPLLVIQGEHDRVVDATNGPAAAHFWAAHSGAQPRPAQVRQRGRRHAMVVTDYKLGGRLQATWIQVQGLGHAWSGGASSEPFSDPRGPDASQLAWAFASRQWRHAGGANTRSTRGLA